MLFEMNAFSKAYFICKKCKAWSSKLSTAYMKKGCSSNLTSTKPKKESNVISSKITTAL